MTAMIHPDACDQEPKTPFDAIKQTRDDGSEFWSSRDLQPLLGYDKWQNFMKAVDDAKRASEIVGAGQDQFTDSSKMVSIGSGAVRELADVELTRYGAYMVAMACDGRKPEVAAAKTYFAIQTRFAEKVQEKMELASAPTTPAAAVDTISVRELATMFAETEAAYLITVGEGSAFANAAHGLSLTLNTIMEGITAMVAPVRSRGHLHVVPNAAKELTATEALPPLSDRDSEHDYTAPTYLPAIPISEDAIEAMTWDEYARLNGLQRCGPCAGGLSRRIRYAADKHGLDRGRTPNGHNFFPRATWDKFIAANRKFYADLHRAHGHGGELGW